MNKNKIPKLLLMLLLFIPMSSGQWISESNINKNFFTLNERLEANVTIKNLGGNDLLVQTILLHSESGAPTVSKSFDVPPREVSTIKLYDFAIDEIYENGDYSIIVRLVDKERSIYALDSKILNFSVTGLDEDFSMKILTCKDPNCMNQTKIFIKNRDIYLNYESDLTGLTIDAILIYPDGSEKRMPLPASIRSRQIGTYTLKVEAEKQEYEKSEKIIQFGVIEEEANIEYEKERTSKNYLLKIILGITVLVAIFLVYRILKKRS